MGIISYLFGQKKKKKKKGTLKEIIEKKSSVSQGVFGNINNDLNEGLHNGGYSIENIHDYDDKLILMSYAYARRTVAAGLVLQGTFSIQDFQQAQKIFQIIQVETIHTKEFQELASALGHDYILSYDKQLTIDILYAILVPVLENHSDDIKTAKNLGIEYTYQDIINSIKNNM